MDMRYEDPLRVWGADMGCLRKRTAIFRKLANNTVGV